MLRRSRLIVVIIVLASILAAWGAVGCSDGFYKSTGTATDELVSPSLPGSAAAQASTQSPAGTIEAIVRASQNMTSATGSFQIDLQMDIDPSQLSPEDATALGMFQGPITASGTMAFDNESRAADLDLTLAAAGFSYNMGVRMLGERMWLRMLGQWYDFTPAAEEAGLGDTALWESAYDFEALQSIMADEGVDWQDWLGDVNLAGEETLADTAVYHLTSTPDLAKLIADMFLLMQSEDFMDLVDPSGTLLESMGQDLPTPADMSEVQTLLPQMLSDVTLDLWAGKGDNLLRQMAAHATIVPPAEAEMDGLESMEVTMTFSYDSVNEPVSVEAPGSFLPFSAFEQMFGGSPGSLLPFVTESDGTGLFSF